MKENEYILFLNESSKKLSRIDDRQELNVYTAETLLELAGGGVAAVNVFSSQTNGMETVYVAGLGKLSSGVLSLLGRNPVGMKFPILPEAHSALLESVLVEIPGGLYETSFRSIPRPVCSAIEKLVNIHSFYSMGIVEEELLLGSVTLMVPDPLKDPGSVETFIRQTAPVFLRVRAVEELRDANQQLALSNQQLRAVEQQLMAANQQLEAQNRQLQNSERKVSEHQQQYSVVVESIRDALIIHNGKTVVFANPAAREFVQETELEGRDLMDFIIPEDRAAVAENMRKRIHGEDVPSSYEISIIGTKGIKLPVEVSVSVIPFAGKKAFLVVLRDLTERKRAQQQREKLQEQLMQSQKMEAVGTLAGGVAHDFNNLLTVIKGHCDIGLRHLDDPQTLESNLTQIRESANRAANLTRQLLLYSRSEPMDMELLNVNTAVSGMFKMLKRLIGEDVTVRTDLADDLWDVKADPGNIEQVIMNLSVNARDAMPGGGTLIFRTSNKRIDEKYAYDNAYARAGRYVCLEVEDTGSGMNTETRERIFEPFFTTKGSGKGTGLGMSVVYGIVQEHNGWIHIYSAPGEGTSFKIYIPASFEKRKPERNTADILKQGAGGGERILLVEDEQEVLAATRLLLEESGYTVETTESAEEALELFVQRGEDFDLIFTDTILPGKTGLQLIDEVRKISPDVRVLLCSGYTGDRLNRENIQEQKLPFIQKPYDLADLLDTVKKQLGEGT